MLSAFVCLAVLAAANGANDVSRAAATLLGGRVSTYPRAMRFTVAFTLAGSLLSGSLAAGVARRFAAVLGSNPTHLALAIPSVLLAASLWIAFSTWRRLPVATTHALVGCLLGVTWVAGGFAACRRIDLARGFVIPLLASPVLACLASLLVSSVLRLLPAPRIAAMNKLHWLSAGMTALSRGINDSAKIWAILLPMSVFLSLNPTSFAHLTQIVVAIAMLFGSILAGRRVTETLAFGIVPMSGLEGSNANLVTATIIIGASLLSFPVASSHVVSGAIFGVGLAGHRHLLRWPTLAVIASAWLLTLPSAALLSIGLYLALGRLTQTASISVWIYALLAIAFVIALIFRLRSQSSSATPLATRLVIFVCNSNTSRSPMAAQICTSLLARIQLDRRVTVQSRGITATEGQSLAPLASNALQRMRVPFLPHHASNLDEETASRADLILCMTGDQVQQLTQLFPAAAAKISRLDPDRDIPNPAGQEQSVFDHVAELLISALDGRLNAIISV